MFAPGTAVKRRDNGTIGVVIEGSSAGLRVAFGGTVLLLHADDLAVASAGPDEALGAGLLGDPLEHTLAVRALSLAHAYRHDPLASLGNARIEPQGHQIFVAHRVTRKLRPRMILADEVGLGKTIEAGLIIKELRAREQIARVLVIAPASLTRQWQTELDRKFNEQFEIIDGVAASFLAKGDGNPFLARDNVICSLAFASGVKRAEHILAAPWDLVIFDEAHRVRRTKNKETLAYKLADELKEVADGFLLLTATPVQLHQFELYSLIQLVQPGVFANEREFEAARREVPELTLLMKDLDRWDALTDFERRTVVERHGRRLRRLGVSHAGLLDNDAERLAAVERFVTLHPYADVMIRNRKAELGLAGRRHAVTVPVKPLPPEVDIYRDVRAYLTDVYNRAKTSKNPQVALLIVSYSKMLTSSAHALRSSFKKRLAGLHKDMKAADRKRRAALLELDDPGEMSSLSDELAEIALDEHLIEFEIEHLTVLLERLGTIRDSKMAEAVRLLEHIQAAEPGAKVVVFTQFLKTQDFLSKVLQANGTNNVVFNGAMSLDQKERAIRDFRERATVLISTEAGGEGRNLQFAHHLVNYDLPWNPMKVEQRIGRLDRIGQQSPVNIYNLVVEGTVEERVLELLHQRIHIFEESVGALDPILGSLEKDIEDIVLSHSGASEATAFAAYGQDLDQRIREVKAVEKRYADLVLDRASFRRDQTNKLMGQPAMATQGDVEDFCRDALAFFGGQLIEHEDGGEAVRLSPRAAARLGLAGEGYHGVFAPDDARRREDLDFFAFGHPVVDTLVQRCGQFDDALAGSRRSGDVGPGLWVEVVWQISSTVGDKRGSLVRHLIGDDLTVHREELRSVPTDEPAELKVPDWAGKALQRSRERFEAEFGPIRDRFLAEFEQVRREKRAQARRLYAYQRDRLERNVERESEWLSLRDHAEASPAERKIIPARRGRLEKDLARLEQLREQHELALEVIEKEQPTVEGRVLWAAVVEGR